MAAENCLWGAPRIHGELLKLGIAVSERMTEYWRTTGGPFWHLCLRTELTRSSLVSPPVRLDFSSMRTKAYLLSVPERLIRSVLGLGAGMARETATVALPDSIRRSQLYQNLVDATLRFVIEQVGGLEGTATRRTNASR